MKQLSSIEDQYRRYALHEKGHQSKTVAQTLGVARCLCRYWGNDKITQYNTAMIRDYLQSQREQKKWSAKTFKLYRQYLKTFFDWLEAQGWIHSNPVSPIKSPRLPIPLPRCLSDQELLVFFSKLHKQQWRYALEAPRNVAIISTFLYSGIRLGELMNLQVADFNVEDRELFVRGKNEKDRVVAIHPELLHILKVYRKEYARLGTGSPWLFPSVKSPKRLTVKNVHAIFHKISDQCGFKVTPHMLRHTFGRICVENRVNMRITQNMLGHSSILTTQRYTYVSSAATNSAIKELEFFS